MSGMQCTSRLPYLAFVSRAYSHSEHQATPLSRAHIMPRHHAEHLRGSPRSQRCRGSTRVEAGFGGLGRFFGGGPSKNMSSSVREAPRLVHRCTSSAHSSPGMVQALNSSTWSCSLLQAMRERRPGSSTRPKWTLSTSWSPACKPFLTSSCVTKQGSCSRGLQAEPRWMMSLPRLLL